MGIGLIGEYVFSGEGEMILGIPVYIHPFGGLKCAFVPMGINEPHHKHSHSDGDHNEEHTEEEHISKEWHAGLRVNLEYDVHLGNVSIGPSVSLDIANTKALVYGLTAGIGF